MTVNIFGQRQHGICSQGRCQLSRTQYFRKAKHLTSKENILVTSNQGTAIPTASSFGEKKNSQSRDSQSSAISNLTPFMNKLLDSSLSASISAKYTSAQWIFRNGYPCSTTQIGSLFCLFFFTQDYASRIIFYLSATSHQSPRPILSFNIKGKGGRILPDSLP